MAESLDPATTSSAVARRHGLHASQLFVWRQQLQRRASIGRDKRRAGVRAGADRGGRAAPGETAGRMEIALGPALVRVGADVDATALRRVLEVVQGLT